MATGSSSYRYIEGTFYSADWVELFTPLDRYGENKFREKVSLLEASGRRASKADLRNIAMELENEGL